MRWYIALMVGLFVYTLGGSVAFAAATLDPATVQAAIVAQLDAMVAPVLAILAVGLAITAGRAAFKRFLKI